MASEDKQSNVELLRNVDPSEKLEETWIFRQESSRAKRMKIILVLATKWRFSQENRATIRARSRAIEWPLRVS